jgi:hypothetical protein
MRYSSQVSLRMAAIAALFLGACAKGGGTVDGDAAQSVSPGSSSAPVGTSGTGGNPGSGSSVAGTAASSPCGNGRIDVGEDCDGVALGGVTCVNLGFGGGQLACDPVTCVYETSMCTGAPGAGGSGG